MAKISTEVVTHSSGDTSKPPDLRLLHYNDVYHVEAGSREPVGGIARFQTVCNHYRDDSKYQDQPELLTLFSGDAFNPSLESSVTKGSHMVPVLNNIGTNAAATGNHDLDFGMGQFEKLTSRCNFPWLLANCLDPALGDNVPLGNCKRTVMLEASNGLKVGLIGLIEREWLDTINTLPPNLQYLSASATAKELALQLRTEGADIVIALTHQREPNDNKLASKVPPGTLDLILGGHDHYYKHSVINGTHILRSGSDFKQLSYLECRRQPNQPSQWDFHIIRRDITATITPDPATLQLVDSITAGLKTKLEKPIGYTAAPLDARFTTVRLKESNYGNFVCDLMRLHYNADACIMASGTIRGDQIYPPGILRAKDIMNCFPFEDPCVVIQCTGKAIVHALENGVSTYPALEGRFPQVSNLTFAFDPAKPRMQRCSDVTIAGVPVDLDREYKLATRDYMVRGKDGFTSLMLEEAGGTAKSVVSEESGMLISMILRQYFMSLKVVGRWKGREGAGSLERHWTGVKEELHGTHPVREPVGAETGQGVEAGGASGRNEMLPSLVGEAQRRDSPTGGVGGSPGSEGAGGNVAAGTGEVAGRERQLVLMRRVMRKWWRLAGLKGHPNMCEETGQQFGVHWTKGIAPVVEGRIRCLE